METGSETSEVQEISSGDLTDVMFRREVAVKIKFRVVDVWRRDEGGDVKSEAEVWVSP